MKSNPRNFQIYIAQTFGKILSQQLGISVLPYTKGQVSSKMVLRFADESVRMLEVPKATYSFEINLLKFKKVLFSENQGVGKAWIYGAYCNVEFKEPFSGHVYLSEKIKKGVTVKEIQGWSPIYEWYPYQESLELLFTEFVKGIPIEKRFKESWAQLIKCK